MVELIGGYVWTLALVVFNPTCFTTFDLQNTHRWTDTPHCLLTSLFVVHFGPKLDLHDGVNESCSLQSTQSRIGEHSSRGILNRSHGLVIGVPALTKKVSIENGRGNNDLSVSFPGITTSSKNVILGRSDHEIKTPFFWAGQRLKWLKVRFNLKEPLDRCQRLHIETFDLVFQPSISPQGPLAYWHEIESGSLVIRHADESEEYIRRLINFTSDDFSSSQRRGFNDQTIGSQHDSSRRPLENQHSRVEVANSKAGKQECVPRYIKRNPTGESAYHRDRTGELVLVIEYEDFDVSCDRIEWFHLMGRRCLAELRLWKSVSRLDGGLCHAGKHPRRIKPPPEVRERSKRDP